MGVSGGSVYPGRWPVNRRSNWIRNLKSTCGMLSHRLVEKRPPHSALLNPTGVLVVGNSDHMKLSVKMDR